MVKSGLGIFRSPINEQKKLLFRTSEQITSWAESLKSDRMLLLFAISWLLLTASTLVVIALSYSQLPSVIPLFYSRVWGESQLAARNYIFLPSVGSVLLGIFNFALGISLYRNDRVASYLLSGAAVLVSILSTITTLNIIRLIL